MIRLTALSILALAATAEGRIGETPEQIAARYGKPTRVDHVFDVDHPLERGNVYRKDGVEISVVFFKGKSSLERFRKLSLAKFTDDEIATLLHADRRIEQWERDEKTSNANLTVFDTTPAAWDGLTASWNHLDGIVQTLEISTMEYGMQRMADDEKAQQPKKQTSLTGF